jgi:Ribosomal protein L25 (general stress protein Ctc)
MAGERTKLIVKTRDKLGSRETRRLRRQGIVPGVLYGGGEPVAIGIEERELRRALTGASGLHSILDVESTERARRTRRSSRTTRWTRCAAA